MTVIETYIGEGQSLELGADSLPITPPGADAASNAYRMQDHNGTLAPLGPHAGRQSPDISAGARLAQYQPTRSVAQLMAANGGETILALSPGQPLQVPETGLGAVTAAFNRLAGGDTLSFPALFWCQGEADQSGTTSSDVYISRMIALYQWWVTNLAPYGDTSALPWIHGQTASWGYYDRLGPPQARIGLAQLQAARSVPNFYCVGGQYQFPYAVAPAAPVHLTAEGYYKYGELQARAAISIRDGNGWPPFAPKAYQTLSDRNLVTFNVPPGGGQLAFDTSTPAFGAAENMGFSLHNTTATIDHVELLSSDKVVIFTQGDIPMDTQLGYGVSQHNGVVGMGNLRDSTTAISRYDNAALPNWALHFLDFVPAPDVTSGPGIYTETLTNLCIAPGIFVPTQTFRAGG